MKNKRRIGHQELEREIQKVCGLLEKLSSLAGEAFLEYVIDRQTGNKHPVVVHLTLKSAVLRDGSIVPLSNTPRLKNASKCQAIPEKLSQLRFSFLQLKITAGVLSNKVRILSSSGPSRAAHKKLDAIREKILAKKARLGLNLKSASFQPKSSTSKKEQIIATNLPKFSGKHQPTPLKDLKSASRRKDALERREREEIRSQKKDLRNRQLKIGRGTIPPSLSTLAPRRSVSARGKK